MSVVNETWMYPAAWAAAPVVWGGVLDGGTVRLFRRASRGKGEGMVISRADWSESHPGVSRLQKDLARGGRLVAGLPPDQVMLRELSVPFQDAAKSAEVWPSVLDAAIPFPLESCSVAFLWPHRTAEGSRCLAVAAREQDLRACLEAWEALGLNPHLLVPEALVLPTSAGAVSIWLGTARSVFVAGGAQGPVSAGGSAVPGREARAVKRFLAARSEGREADGVSVRTLGPGAGTAPEGLESALATAGAVVDPAGVNLRAGTLAHPEVAARLQRQGRGWMALAASLLLVALLLPFAIGRGFAHVRAGVVREIGERFADFTGYASPAPGQEVLLLERELETRMGPVYERISGMRTREQSAAFADVLYAAQFTGVLIREVEMRGAQLLTEVAGDAGQVERFAVRLREGGWQVTPRRTAEGVWRVEGQVRP